MIIIILLLSLILNSPVWATVNVVRYPSGTPVQACQPNDTNANCLAGSGGVTNLTPNVGIGSAAPGYQLDVQGTVRAIKFIGDGSGLTGINSSNYWINSGSVGIGTYNNVGIGTIIPTDNLYISNVTSGGATINSSAGGIGGITPNTAFMFHFDGSNGSTTFTDSSLNPQTVTRHGSPTISTAQAVFNQSGIFASASTDYLSMPNSSLWNIFGSTGAIEYRVRFTTLGTVAFWFQGDGTGNTYNWILYSNGSHKFLITAERGAVDKGTYTVNWTPSTNVWYALDFEFTPTSVLVNIDGVSQSVTQTTAWNSPGAVTGLGTINGGDAGTGFSPLDGYLDEYRFTNGVNNYTTSYTLPTSPYSNTTAANAQLTFAIAGSQQGFIGANGSISNSVQIGQGSTASITIPSSENVGIGSTAPGQVLDINGNLRTTGTNQHIFGSDNSNSIQSSATTAGDMQFKTNAIERMRITNAGNIGLGTTTPKGSFIVTNGNVGIGTWVPVSTLSINGGVAIGLNFVNTAVPANNLIVQGNIGLGTINPITAISNTATQLCDSSGTCVNGSGMTYGSPANTGFSGYEVGITNPGGAVGNRNVLLLKSNNSTDNGSWILRVENAAGPVFNVGSSGNVGLGTISPQGSLIITNGNVGVGTWVPNMPLSVNGNVGIGTMFVMHDQTGGTCTQITTQGGAIASSVGRC